MLQNVRVRLNVGGTVLHTSLHTVLEGARRGSSVLQCLSAHILGPQANDATMAPTPAMGPALDWHGNSELFPHRRSSTVLNTLLTPIPRPSRSGSSTCARARCHLWMRALRPREEGTAGCA